MKTRESAFAAAALAAAAVLALLGACGDTALLTYFRERSVVDNWGEPEYLSAGDDTDYYYYGYSCDVDGDYIIVGAKNYTGTDGRVYFYYGGGGAWEEQASILAGGTAGDSVSINGDYAIVGDSNSDAAMIYKRDGINWSLIQTLNGTTGSLFGHAVSIHGDFALVGAHKETVSTLANSGKAYVFYRNSGGPDNWGLLHDLQCSDGPATNLEFSWDVAISENYAVISAKKYALTKGAAYIYEKVSDSQWGTSLRKENARIVPAESGLGDYFGASVDVDGNIAVVGYEGKDEALAYRKEGADWKPSRLTAPDPSDSSGFGRHVAASGKYVIIGSYNSSGNPCMPAYVFECIDDIWLRTPELQLPENTANSEFQAAVGISHQTQTAVVGVCFDDEKGDDAGKVVIFKRR